MALGSVRNWGCRLETDLVLRGWRAAVLENELLRVTVLLDKGSNIYEFLYKPRDVDFMWHTPQGLRRPPSVPTTRADGGFLEYYEGAWQEIMPSGGPPCSWGGSQFGQHDETPQLNWDATVVEDGPESVAIRCSVQTVRSPFLLEKTLRLVSGKAVLFIDERLTNYGAETWPYMWGHHPALGEPFLDETCRLDCAAQTVIVHEPALTPTPRLPAGGPVCVAARRGQRGSRRGPEHFSAEIAGAHRSRLPDGSHGRVVRRHEHEPAGGIWHGLGPGGLPAHLVLAGVRGQLRSPLVCRHLQRRDRAVDHDSGIGAGYGGRAGRGV